MKGRLRALRLIGRHACSLHFNAARQVESNANVVITSQIYKERAFLVRFELAQYQHLAEVKAVIENIRNAPDFVLVSQDKKEVHLVEVKYRSHRYTEDLRQIAQETLKIWNPCWLFVASPDGFFFEPCNTVLNNDGHIGALVNEKFVDHAIRDEYLKLLNQFEI